MSVESAATFLAGSLLIGFGFSFLAIVVVFINHIFSKYWIPIKWLNFIDIPVPVEVQQQKQEEKKEVSK
jgi:hypothetical protein